MEYAKKMVLVDPKTIAGTAPPQAVDVTSMINPELSAIDITLQGLQRGLQNLLQNHDLPLDDKAKLYSNFLQQYLTMRQKQRGVYTHPSGVSLKEPIDRAVNQQSPQHLEMQVVNSVPKPLQKHAKLLLERVKEDSDLGWNDRGELLVENQVIPQSNIVDLIGDLLSKRKNFNPPGWEELSRKLYEGNVPQNLVRNPDRLAYMHGASAQSPSREAVQAAIHELDPSRVETVRKSRSKQRKIVRPRRTSRVTSRGRQRKASSLLTDGQWQIY
jgi:hypothetical protein